MLICSCTLISELFYLALVMTSLLTVLIAVYFIDIHVISQAALGYTSPIITQFMEILVQL